MNRDEGWLLSEKYQGERSEEFFADCKRLAAGEPLAYVIGHTPFLDTTIWLPSKPLIPRVETEYWVDTVIHLMRARGDTRILDLCAGSGCIGTAVAKALPTTRVDFVEIDTHHHPTIILNVRENDIALSRTRIFGGDLFENITDTYDVILTNPPYIDRDLHRTASSVLEHEPHRALFADDAGYALILRIVRESQAHLLLNGMLVIEHEPEHVDRLHALASECGYTSETRTDQYGVARYTLLTRKQS